MGLVQMLRIGHFWSTCNFTKSPLFDKYMSCNSLQNILWNLYLSENTRNSLLACPGHVPLHKVRNIIHMAQDNFKYVYRPSTEVTLDETSCPLISQVHATIIKSQNRTRL